MAAAIVTFAAIWLVSLAAAAEYYVVSSDGAACPTGVECHNISYYLSQRDVYLTSDTTLTFLNGTHLIEQNETVEVTGVNNLTLLGLGTMEPGFHWSVRQSSVHVACTNSLGGLSFYNCSEIVITQLTFFNCGSRFNGSRYREYLALLEDGLYSNLYDFRVYESTRTSLSFFFSSDIAFYGLSVQNCSGYCLLAFNTGNIWIDDTYVAHSNPMVYIQECCNEGLIYQNDSRCTGGNALFLYLDLPDCDNVTVTYNLTIVNSSFSFGAGHSLLNVAMTSVNILGVTRNTINAIFDSVLLYANNGGGFSAFTAGANINLVNVTSIEANQNLCPRVDSIIGGLQLSVSNSLYCTVQEEYIATQLNIINSEFSHNTAVEPAGINLPTSFAIASDLTVGLLYNITNTVLNSNKARFGSAFAAGGTTSYFVYVVGQLVDVVMSGNMPDSTTQLNSMNAFKVVPPSCVLLVNAGTLNMTNVTISNHNMVGAFVYNSQMFVLGDVTLSNNTGDLGGAISLVGNSLLTLYRSSKIKFINNRAVKGAAIFISQPLVISLLYPSCPIQLADFLNDSNSTLYFSDNRASVTGNILYGGQVDLCLLNEGRRSAPISDYFNDFFNYSAVGHGFHDVSSNILSVCFCSDGLPDCNTTTMTTGPYLNGQAVTLSLAAVGERQGFTTGTINITCRTGNFTTTRNIRTAACKNVSLPLEYNLNSTSGVSYNGTNVSYIIKADVSYNHIEAKPVYLMVPLAPCPRGFYLNNASRCVCSRYLVSVFPNADCNINTQTVTIEGDGWIGYDEDGDDDKGCVQTALQCPLNYCLVGKVTTNLSNPSSPCAKNRTGRLCGRCINGYSVVLGSNACRDCTNNNGLALLVLFAAAGIGLIVLLLFLNLTVSVGTINGLIFYANIIKVNEAIFFPKAPIPVLSQLTSWLNLDFGIETCFYNEMTSYTKVWLQFVFPVYVWLIILAVIVASHFSSRLARVVGTNGVPVLATLMLLSYVKIIFTFVQAVKLSQVSCNGVSSSVWAVDGTIPYWGTQHTILFAFAIAVLVVTVVPYTIIIVLSPVLERQSQLLGRFWLNFLKPVSDAYCGPFKDPFRFWTGFVLLARLFIAILVPFLGPRDSLFVVMLVTLGLLAVAASVGGVYNKHYLNVLENWFFANVLGASLLALGGQGYVGTIVSASLVYLTFCGIIAGHCVWRFKLICSSCCSRQRLSMKANRKFSKSTSRTNVTTTDVLVNRMRQSFIERPDTHLNKEDYGSNDQMKFRESLLDYEDPLQ